MARVTTTREDTGTIGKRIRYVREHIMEITREELANRMAIPPTTLKNYELDYREFGSQAAMTALWNVPVLQSYAMWILSGSNEQGEQLIPEGMMKAAA